ncbi:MAG: glycosyltransferase family 9 protein [Alphaproteobacteria bacterium]
MADRPVRRILVIKLGALGDIVLSFMAFGAIRRHHPEATIVLLTTPPFEELANKSGWFDEVWPLGRPGNWHVGEWLTLARRLRGGKFDQVYDLQRSGRTRRYRRLMTWLGGGGARWPAVGPRGELIALGDPRSEPIHTAERHMEYLTQAGITDTTPADLSWLTSGFPERFGLSDGFLLLAPGGSPHRPEKRWPAERFAELASRVAMEGTRPVLIGTQAEAAVNSAIAAASPEAMDLTGKTSLFDIAAMATRAQIAVGNDTGPMHLIAAAGCPSVVLFSDASDPARTAPRGPYVVVMRKPNLADLPLTEVAAAMRLR